MHHMLAAVVPFDILPSYLLQTVSSFDGGGAAARLAGGNPTLQRHLAAAARLEAAAVEQAYGDVRAAETHLAAAEAALGLSMELTGEFVAIGQELPLQNGLTQVGTIAYLACHAARLSAASAAAATADCMIYAKCCCRECGVASDS